MHGPNQLIPNTQAAYEIIVDNNGGLAAENVALALLPDLGLQFTDAMPAPISQSPLQWNLDTLPAGGNPVPIVVTMSVDSGVSVGSTLSMTANITTTTADSNLTNNTATAAIPTSLDDALTLFFVAPERLTAKYGASPILDKLYEVAAHDQVQGVIIDVMDDEAVAAAYADWDSSPSSWQAANEVAAAVKALIDDYTITYPHLRYLVFVGGDDIIPFYRVPDQNPTFWAEKMYAHRLPAGTMQAALSNNMILTDNFYADREPTKPSSPYLA